MLKFSSANAKLQKLTLVSDLQPYLTNKRKVYSLDLLSGFSCPYADKCLSKAIRTNNTTTIKDGPNTEFRCFSASQEVIFPAVYNLRKNNFDYLQKQIRNGADSLKLSKLIESQLPKNVGVLRMHVGGDFFSQIYFDAISLLAQRRPDIIFYAYTKSIKFWANRIGQLPPNFVLTASRGGRLDNLIDEYKLRESVVIANEKVVEAIIESGNYDVIPDSVKHISPELVGLPIDHDDSHAANPQKRNESFALLIHGIQPKNSEASKAKSALKGIGSYQRK